jgi:hypothetical protein
LQTAAIQVVVVVEITPMVSGSGSIAPSIAVCESYHVVDKPSGDLNGSGEIPIVAIV